MLQVNNPGAAPINAPAPKLAAASEAAPPPAPAPAAAAREEPPAAPAASSKLTALHLF